jgi:predicted RNase H-like HicB family nuclease
MRNEFTSVIEEDGEWFIGYCPEIPGANGQGRTVEECRNNLAEAIALILEDRREDGLRGVPKDATQDPEQNYRPYLIAIDQMKGLLSEGLGSLRVLY